MKARSPSIAILVIVTAILIAATHKPEPDRAMKKLTPILVVEEIEPVLPFWVERLGFEKTVEVPEGDKLGFVILTKGTVEIMYQTRAGIGNDAPALLDMMATGGSMLFIEVESIDEIERALDGVEPVVPRRETFYGATEIFVRDPAGHIIGFAQMKEQ